MRTGHTKRNGKTVLSFLFHKCKASVSYLPWSCHFFSRSTILDSLAKPSTATTKWPLHSRQVWNKDSKVCTKQRDRRVWPHSITESDECVLKSVFDVATAQQAALCCRGYGDSWGEMDVMCWWMALPQPASVKQVLYKSVRLPKILSACLLRHTHTDSRRRGYTLQVFIWDSRGLPDARWWNITIMDHCYVCWL